MSYKLSGIVGESLQSWDLPEGETHVGRSSDLAISLADRSVSRTHAVLRRSGDNITVEDLGSRNGTSVNGVRIQAARSVASDDVISFGSLALKLVRAESSIRPSLAEHTQLDSTFKLNWKDVREAKSAPDQAPEMFQVLTELGEFLVRHQPQQEIFEACLATVEKLVPFQRACLLLLDDEGTPQLRAARFKTEQSNLQLALSQTMVQTVIHERASLLVHDAQSDQRFQLQESVILGKIRSALVAPLFDNTSVIGVLYVDTSELTVAYSKDHLRRLALLANILAVKITNARLLDVQREQQRMQQEMETAARIQRLLLASEPPCPQGYTLCVRLEPSTEVGGDLYDVIPLDDGCYAVVLGDVVGHGVGAAMLMANTLAGVRAIAQSSTQPVEIVSRLHELIFRSTDPTSYVTIFLGVLDPRTHEMRYVNAGHEAPTILRAGHDPVRLASTGPPVGLLPGMKFESGSAAIPPGALFAAWSDGIPEAHVPTDGVEPAFFGEAQALESILAAGLQTPLLELTNNVFDRVDEFLNGAGAPDDRTLLLLRRSS
jgi:serine phosphatase RsbU (regulator of sigma subunit)/pSer/pThr/pTyr-binding forkhead associated (FHA) protein